MPWTTPPRVLGTRPVWLDSGDERAFPGTVRAAALLALLTAALLQCILAWSRRFHTDEWQHLHAAWCVAQGLLPYRDFFEHHTPALWYLLAPWMAWSRPELDPDRAVAFLRGVRLLFLVPTAVLIALTWRLARAHAGSVSTAWMSVCLLASTPMFVRKTVDVRPDAIAAVLVLFVWLALIGGIRASDPSGVRLRLRFAAAGAALGTAVLFTQKILLVIPAVGLCVVAYGLDPGLPGRRSTRLGNVVVMGLAAVLPGAALLLAFLSIGQVGVFLESNLWLNLRWIRVVPRLFAYEELWSESPFLLLAGGAGFLVSVGRLRDPAERARGTYVVPVALVGCCAMQLASPAPWPQSLLGQIPLLAILAAEATHVGAATLARLTVHRAHAAVVAWIGVFVLALVPGFAITLAQRLSNGDQLEGVRYVQAVTSPGDTVLDGVTGFGVFRPHAFFYAHVNWDIRGMIPEEWRQHLEEGLVSGRIAPRVVLLDDDIRYLSRAVPAFVQEHYREGPMAAVWLRETASARDEAIVRLTP